MKVEVEFTCDLDPDHPDWPKEQWCQVLISEDDLPLDKDTMRRLAITPTKLREVFAEAREEAKDIKPSDRVRIVADRDRQGGFFVVPIRYSPHNDPFERAIARAVRKGRRLDREAVLREEDRTVASNDRELERAIRRGKQSR